MWGYGTTDANLVCALVLLTYKLAPPFRTPMSHTDNMDVRVHATTDPLRMDFKSKNFEYKTTGFHDLIDKASRSDFDTTSPKYYLRSTSVEDVKSPVIFEKDFPRLAKDFQLPQGLVDPGRLFSSVFRYVEHLQRFC